MNNYPNADECYMHGHEPVPKKYFRICGECWHVFPTADDLVRDYVDNAPLPAGPTPDVDDIHFCPHCTHDF